MKKLVSLLLALSMCLCIGIMFTSCENDGVNAEEWEEMISEQKFDNVTIDYTFENDDMTQVHVVKIAGDKVYRSMSAKSNGVDMGTEEETFADEMAEIQKDLFIGTFLALLEERENFEYQKDEKCYIAPEKVTATINRAVEYSVTEEMTNGKVQFDKDGNLEYFSCTLSETVNMKDEDPVTVVGEVVWTFSNYGTTEIK